MVQPVDFEIIKPTKAILHPQVFLKKLQSVTSEEHAYCAQLLRKAAKHQTRMHLLVNSEDFSIVGFIALSVATLRPGENLPCVVIDYLLTAIPYRGLVFEQLGTRRISEYLVGYTMSIASGFNKDVPFRYVALLPAHDKLIPLYNSLRFFPHDNSGWLFCKVAQ